MQLLEAREYVKHQWELKYIDWAERLSLFKSSSIGVSKRTSAERPSMEDSARARGESRIPLMLLPHRSEASNIYSTLPVLRRRNGRLSLG